MRRILVVEDQDEIREVLRVTLELGDFDLEEADNGEHALQQVARWKPDLVLMDVMMPGTIDGLAACQRIKQDAQLRRTKVILLSARGQSHDINAGYRAGADAYMVKPFSPLELLSTIDRVLP